MTDEELIRELIRNRIEAMRRKDAAAAIESLDDDIVAFELLGPLRVASAQARDVAAFQSWLDSWEGPVDTEIRDLQVHVAGAVAFCHSLMRLRGQRPGGAHVDFWMRSTFGFRRRGDVWRIVHAHTSVPIHADGTFRAAIDLKPE